jgi:two-component sensor histidine kinase
MRGGPSYGAIEPSILAAEADHRIANHLALLSGYLRLKDADLVRQIDGPGRNAMHLLLEGLGAQIDAVARLHRSLADDGADAPAELDAHLHEVCAPFGLGLCGSITLAEDFQSGRLLTSDQMLPLVRIVAEALTNALKHAHPDGGPGTIVVRSRRDRAGAVVVEVIDDGAGLPATFDPTTDGGLGFRLVRSFAKQLRATCAFESDGGGLRVRLTLPPQPLAPPRA